MGKKAGWFSSVKKVLNSESKERKEKKSRKSKGWFGKHKNQESDPSQAETSVVNDAAPPETAPPPAPPAPPVSVASKKEVKFVSAAPIKEVKLIDSENEQARHAYSVAIATAVAAEAAVAAAQAAAEVVRLTNVPRVPTKSMEETAAVKIQKTFRGHKARKSARTLKGLSRLKSLIQGQSVKRQATTTLRCMQTMSRVQTQIRERRSRMTEQNHALQRQLMQKNEKELEKSRTTIGEDWDGRTHSKEQADKKLNYKNDAATRRERALAYSYTHQQTWRTSPRSADHTFMDPNNPHWGWSWLERWMAARPWENQELKTTTKVQLNLDNKTSPTPKNNPTRTTPARVSVSSPRTKTPTSVTAGKITRPTPSPRKSVGSVDDDAKSTTSSIGGSRLKTKVPSPLGLDKSKSVTTTGKDSVVTTPARKRLSFSSPPSALATRRYSVDAKGLH